MPVKLLPSLRLLNPPLPVTRFPTMNFKLSPNSSRAVPALHRIFPFKLKYLGFSTRVNSQQQQQQQLGVRKLSTRSFRPVASSEFDRRGRRGGEVRGSKSLIEDEAELDSWVSDLGSDPFRSNKGFSKHDNVSDFRKGRGSETRSGRDRDFNSMKRRRESESDDFYESNRRGNRNSVNSFSRNNNNNNNNSRFNGRSNSQVQDGNRENYSRKKNYGFERGNASSFTGRRNEMKGNNLKKTRFLDDDDADADDMGEERGRIMSGIRDLLSEEVSDVDDDDDDDDTVLRNNARSSMGLVKESGEKSVVRSSPGKYDSFMSESRYIFEQLDFCK